MRKIFTLVLFAAAIFMVSGITVSENVNAEPKSPNSIVKLFKDAGFKGEVEKAEKGMLDYMSKHAKPGKAVDAVIFRSKKHPCMVIKFSSVKAAKAYMKGPMSKLKLNRAGKNAVTRNGKFILFYDSKKDISFEMVILFKKS